MSARAVLIVALLAGSAGTAGAAPPSLPRVSSLPAGDIPALHLRARPAGIGAGERVAGFWVSRPYAGPAYRQLGARALRNLPQYVMIHASEAAATAATSGRTPPGALRDTTCFIGHQSPGTATTVVEWGSSFTGSASLHPHEGKDVHPVRSEQVVVDPDGTARLHVVQAWLDARTLGVRLASRTTLPLSQVAAGPRGLHVYAVRRGGEVEIVVTTPPAARAQPLSLGLQFQQANGSFGAQSQCGHVRFALRTKGGDGDTATVQADIPLPPRQGERRGEGSVIELFGLDKLPPEHQSTRARQLRIGVSTSSTSRDPDALLSVAMGWVGKERNLF